MAYGSAKLECGLCYARVGDGWSGYFRFGGTLNPRLRLGIEANGWARTFDDPVQILFVTANLYVYPHVSNNFWLQGGVGLATTKAQQNVDDIKARGAGVAAGIGYDWSVSGGNFVIVPYATYLQQLTGKLDVGGPDGDVSAHARLLELGVGLGYSH